eukprot:TRINITY_DN108_c0_g1_i3.p1 TRINITY_DN108_c0_g1~~TRINITY_DN108_c0_g1_i3.p1  ORF type:complete len:209 (+),score=46.80 TRINITY_DN108_c0_g1_i3:59-628(+)
MDALFTMPACTFAATAKYSAATKLHRWCSASIAPAVRGERSSFSFRGRAHTLPLNSFSLSFPIPRSDKRQKRGQVVCGLFGLGFAELAVIAGVAVVLFGPKQLPEFGKSLGKTVKGFQQAAQEFQSEIKGEKGEEESPAAAEAPATDPPATSPVSVSAAPDSPPPAAASSPAAVTPTAAAAADKDQQQA